MSKNPTSEPEDPARGGVSLSAARARTPVFGVLRRPTVVALAAASLVLGLTAPAAAAPAPGASHTVESGDTLSEIAARYGVPLGTVFALNGLGPDSVIYPGDTIRLSGDDESASPRERSSTGSTYTVQAGDTLGRIAARHGASLDAVLELNGLDRSSIIHPGDVIRIPGEAPAAASDPPEQPAPSERTYTVVTGDTLGRIAARHGVALDAVLQLNGLDRSDFIFPGDVLRIPGSGGGAGGGGQATEDWVPSGNPLTAGPNATSRVILTYDDCPRSLDAFSDVVSWAGDRGIGLVIAPTGNCITAFSKRHGVDIAALARSHGQYVINHSVSHRDLTTLSCEDAAGELGAPGVVTNFGRPPYGALNSAAHCGYAQVGMSPWLWTADTLDWTGKSQGDVVASVVQQAQPGGTVLMHLQWNGFSPSAIDSIEAGLAARGLELCRAYPGTSPVVLPQSLPC